MTEKRSFLAIDRTLSLKRGGEDNYQCVFNERVRLEPAVSTNTYRASWGIYHPGIVCIKDKSELYSDVFMDFW